MQIIADHADHIFGPLGQSHLTLKVLEPLAALAGAAEPSEPSNAE